MVVTDLTTSATVTTTTTTSTSLTVTGLNASTTYSVQVVATNLVGNSPPAGPVNGTTAGKHALFLPERATRQTHASIAWTESISPRKGLDGMGLCILGATVPDAPTAIVVLFISAVSVTVEWAPSLNTGTVAHKPARTPGSSQISEQHTYGERPRRPDATVGRSTRRRAGGLSAVGYQFQLADSNGTVLMNVTVPTDSVTLANLTAATDYVATVATINALGQSSQATLAFRTACACPDRRTL